MRILLTHAYAKENKGDAAIVSVLLRQLDNVFPDSDTTISIYDDDAKYASTFGCKVISSSMYIGVCRFQNLLLKLLYVFYVESFLLLWALLYRLFGYSMMVILPRKLHTIACEYLENDLYVAAGGGYLRGKKGMQQNINLILLLNPFIIGILLQKPIILYTQSIGPFATAFQKWISKSVLNRVQLILVREDHTLATLKAIGVKTEHIIRTTDAGFLFDSNKEIQLSDFVENPETLKSKTLVGITVRKWLDQKGQDNFERSVASFVDKITEDKNISVIFISQVTSTVHNDDDRDVASRIVSLVANKQVINCTGDYDHYELKKFYSCLDFLVGTRFHSVIFSLTSYVPALAIEYEYKTSGIMKDLGLSEWVIPIEQVTAENLYDQFKRLSDEKDTYKQKLYQVLPDYILRAKEAEQQIQEAYQQMSSTALSPAG